MTNDTSDDEPDLCPIIPYKPDSGGSPDSQYPLTPSSRGSLSQSIKPSAKGTISAKSVAPSQQEQDGGMDNDVQLAEGLSEDLKEKAGSRRGLGVQGENKGEETGPPVKKAKTTHGTHASEERKTRFGSKPPESDGVEVAEEDNAMCVGGADEETTVRSDGDEGEVEDFEPRSVEDKGLEKKTTLAARMAPWNGATRRGSSGSGNTKASRKSAKGKEEENTREEEEDQGGAASARELDGLHEEIAQPITQLKEQTTDYHPQIESLLIHNTELEKALEARQMRHEAEVQALKDRIEELTTQLSILGSSAPLEATIHVASENNGEANIEMLTGEAAEKEKMAPRRNTEEVEEVKKRAGRVVKNMLAKVKELTEISENELKMDLHTEINVPIARAGVAESLKHAATTTLYEALTNLVVTNVEFVRGEEEGTEQTIWDCVFTESDKSLAFTLSQFKLVSDTDPTQMTDQIRYVPNDLNEESEEFVQSLGLLSGRGVDVVFSKDQLDVFHKMLYNTLTDWDEYQGVVQPTAGDSHGGTTFSAT